MTDNEIIKALECCAENTEGKCRECPFHKLQISCIDVLERSSLDLINRQREEIDRLKVENESLRMAANSYKMHYEEMTEDCTACAHFVGCEAARGGRICPQFEPKKKEGTTSAAE